MHITHYLATYIIYTNMYTHICYFKIHMHT